MKRHVALMVAILGSFLISTESAQAEVRFIVPFDFSVGQVLLPSGTYTVSRVGSVQNFLQLRNDSFSSDAIGQINSVQLNPGQVSEATKLVFHRYGDQYFLAQFWTTGSTAGFELPRSKAEREIAKKAAKPKTEILTASK
jgi:hypothetical protein